MPHEATALLLLPSRERIAAPRIRILARAHLDAHRGAQQIEAIAKEVREITPVPVADPIGLRAVNDDHGWIASALVRVAQARPASTHALPLI